MTRFLPLPLILTLVLIHPLRAQKHSSEQAPTLDQYVQQVNQRSRQTSNPSPGSLYTSNGRLADGIRDVRAGQVYDLITIVVSDSTSAVSTSVSAASSARIPTASMA